MEFNESDFGREYLKFCELRNNALHTKKMDLSNIDWFYPTNLLPLGIFIKSNRDISVIPPTASDVLSYYNIIIKGKRHVSSRRSYHPIAEIPPDEHQRERMLEPLYAFESDYIGGRNAFAYLIGELVDNVYQHSSFSNAYIMAQKYQTKRFIEISIMDNGISIPGAFKEAGFEFDDTKALSEAINGRSTKRDKERGFGLISSINLLTKGLGGECLIVSRKGGFTAKGEDKKTFYNMGESHALNGTLICIRVPYITKTVNIYDYIEQ
ncbi:hypothetical protein C5S31_11275 [ANME-1 cluster archaeon GoMg2]|nr:hypothetical protein [ANME-1 cluster archaeon GoMg2]